MEAKALRNLIVAFQLLFLLLIVNLFVNPWLLLVVHIVETDTYVLCVANIQDEEESRRTLKMESLNSLLTMLIVIASLGPSSCSASS